MSQGRFDKWPRVREHFASRIHECADPAIGGSNQEPALLDGSELGESQVLPGFECISEPSIVGHINDEFGIVMAKHLVDETRAEIFVTDIRGNVMGPNF